MLSIFLVAGAFAVSLVRAQSPTWGQCGGIGWSGATTCVSGNVCTAINAYYSQCIPGSAAPTSTSSSGGGAGGGGSATTSSPPAGTTVAGARLLLAGDSTTAPDTGTAYAGWGTQIGKYLSLSVINDAIPGKSSRSFTDQGSFNNMYNSVRSGDVVIIEFGHNEGGGPSGNPQQGVCPGTDTTTTCKDPSTGQTVYTYFKYMEDAVKTFKSKGANVLVTSQTPNNPFNNPGSTPVYVSYAHWQVAAQTGVAYVDHYSYLLKEYQTLGASVVNGLFPVDNIHTSSTGADYAAQALIRGVLCASNNPLAPYVKNKNVLPSSCL